MQFKATLLLRCSGTDIQTGVSSEHLNRSALDNTELRPDRPFQRRYQSIVVPLRIKCMLHVVCSGDSHCVSCNSPSIHMAYSICYLFLSNFVVVSVCLLFQWGPLDLHDKVQREFFFFTANVLYIVAWNSRTNSTFLIYHHTSPARFLLHSTFLWIQLLQKKKKKNLTM